MAVANVFGALRAQITFDDEYDSADAEILEMFDPPIIDARR